MLVELPFEIWAHIAGYLSSRDLVRLVGLNRTFFELIMDELYNELSFISSDPQVFAEKLKSLQDPSLVSRVKILTIWPSAIREAVNAAAAAPDPVVQVHKRNNSHILERYVGKFKFSGRKATASASTTSGAPNATLSSDERSKLLNEGLRHLSLVEELRISWYLDQGRADAWTFPLFPAIWRAVGSTIRVLILDVQIHVLGDALSSCGSLPRVERLELTLRRDKNQPLRPNTPAVDDTMVPYFVNKFAASLQHLTMKTIGHQDLTFFTLMGVFPRLSSLQLLMPLDSHHMREATGFAQFLVGHRQGLKVVSIRYAFCCRECRDDGFGVPGEPGRHIIYSDLTLEQLHTLELGLYAAVSIQRLNPYDESRSIANGQFDNPTAFISSITQMAPHLTSLTLVDRCLTLSEAKLVLKAFPGISQLKKLALFAKKLTPQLIDLIATTCLSLSALTLDVEMVCRSETADTTSPHGESNCNDVDGFVLALYQLAIHDEDYRYRTWTLSDISILTWEFKVGKRLNVPCMNALQGVVPTIRRFAGTTDDSVRVDDGRRPSTDSTRSRQYREAAVYSRNAPRVGQGSHEKRRLDVDRQHTRWNS